jgi:catechol 2,3-dioxygenase-like lactoylglutathione lyase family enzyme
MPPGELGRASLGRLLEISLATTDIAASLEFYESLGFVQARVGEAWPHPYAVVTDGRISLGLHGGEFESPLPTWVAPDLRQRVSALQALGVEVEDARLDDLALHQLRLLAPPGQRLRLLEARTFSPPDVGAGHRSRLGYFEEYALASHDPAADGARWEPLGFVAFDAVTEPWSKVVASSRDLNVGFHDLDLDSPALVFSAADIGARIETLRSQGHRFARRLPRALAANGADILQAPEGTLLLLVPDDA